MNDCISECWCSCHRTGAEHCVPCCFDCFACGQDRIVDFESHKAVCTGRRSVFGQDKPKPT